MLEDCTIVIIDMGNLHEIVTAAYLDAMYSQVHTVMQYCNYHYDVDNVTRYLTAFVKKMCRYLQTEGLLPITRAVVEIGAPLSPITLRLELDTGMDVMIETLGYSGTSAWYGLHPGYRGLYERTVFGTDKLIPGIREELGYRDCFTCRYSDTAGKYCGLGMEMYINNCGRIVYVHPSKKNYD